LETLLTRYGARLQLAFIGYGETADML
jgi:hypothetical protein